MRIILKFFKICWRVLNFIRDLVMNLVFLVFVLLLTTIIGLTLGQRERVELVGDQGALLVNLDGYLTDNRDDKMNWRNALKEFENQRVPSQISTFDVIYAIETAKEDERIKGLVLDLNYFEGADIPALEYVGTAIQHFKASGKPVIAFSDNYTQAQYFLASYADEIYMNPIGQVAIQGLASQNLYFKSMLEKLEVTPHIFRVGTYKSAIEPFMRNDMSPEAKANLQQWLGSMWDNYQTTVANNRSITKNMVLPPAKTYLTELKSLNGDSANYALQRKLVTNLTPRLEIDKKLSALFGQNEDKTPKLLKFDTYLDTLPDRMSSGGENKIAVINVEGTIIDGESGENEAGGDTIAQLLRQAYDDSAVKAVVLRVNSPGGSAFASEVIRQEVDNLQQAGKPVVVSMGAIAASGGYWISSTADYIVADKNTITGSIGIFAVFPTFEKTIKNIGVSADGIATSPFGELSLFSAISPEVNDLFQIEIEHGYDKFLNVVSEGRNLSKEQVDKVAQGRVWLGETAYEHKLVDQLGNFDVAVDKAGELVNAKLATDQQIDDFSVEWLTDEEHSLFKTLMRDLRKNTKMLIQNSVMEMFGLPQEIKQVKAPLGILSKFNDPRGQYLYCLNCGVVR